MSMQPRTWIRGVLVAIALSAVRSAAAQTASQTVNFQVDAINQISVSAPSVTLNVTTATAGSAPTAVTSSSTTWAVTCNQTGAKITASIGSAMPSGVTLTASLGAPAGAASAGAQTLGTVAVDLVTGITKLNQSGLSVTYSLSATAAAGVVTATSRTVTYTITGGT
ncbi:hypothetical protein J421_3328 [Gemmatirosa kalamazoonensis]|uniref:Uncharacterized protein n=1 Tax=Gemmatirosa kalamazoonensis TaxID=861299 RepID=W0RKL8_9BACT|nr:hypothetical protein [Gemmatirosa kalamazoonensis]AHG90865.1 hypothetical protein J421_3328 [Gemmatirosa kalamazoonensis]